MEEGATIRAEAEDSHMNHPGLDRLWALAGEFRSKFADDWNLAFDDIGMILLRKIESISLPPFPDNCVQFATTGIAGFASVFSTSGPASTKNHQS